MPKLKVTTPPEGDHPAKELTPQQRQDWNNYVDYVEKKGFKGSPQLDKKDTGLAKKLFDEYVKANPATSINYDTVKSVQYEMQKLKDSAQEFAARRNDPNAKNIMSGVSPVDGWPGSKTTSFKFPAMTDRTFRNDALVSQKNLGLVNSELRPSALTVQPVPLGTKLEKMADGRLYYQDPKTQDMVLYK